MRKKKLSVCAFVCAVFLCMGACGTVKDDDTNKTATETDTSEVYTETAKKAERIQLQINNQTSLNYRLVCSENISSDTREVIKQFVLDMAQKLGAQPKVVADTTPEASDIKEIIIGTTSRSKSIIPENYAAYGMKSYEDGTIAIYGHSGEMIEKALTTFIDNISKMQDGNYYYRGYEYIESSLSQLLEQLPTAGFGNVETVYQSHQNTYQVSINGVTTDSLTLYGKKLTDAGYTLYSTNSIDANNSFATYKNADNAVHLGYHESNQTIEIIIEKLGYLPPVSALSADKKVNASITQMTMAKDKGMSYVIQLIDGSFVVIDGGVADSDGSKELIELLEAKNVGTGYAKPQVTWMFTHSHPDHIQLAEGFITQYSNRFDLVTVCANFIELDTAYSDSFNDGYSFNNLMSNVKTKFPNANIFTYHTGQVLYLAGCKIDFYLTHEDIYPITLGTLNSASSVWKFTFDGGKTFMILGDTTETGAELLNSYYGGTVKSDIMQAAHHGTNASNGTTHLKALYANINPTTVMWANSDASSVLEFAANSGLFAKSGLVSIFSTETKSLNI